MAVRWRLSPILVLALFTVWFTLTQAVPLPAATGNEAKIDPAKEFSIVDLRADVNRRTVELKFSQPTPKKILRSQLRFLPGVGLNWSKTKVFDDGRVVFHGNFQYGQSYVVSLPEGLMVKGKAYRRDKVRVTMPDSPPRVEFIDQGAVIELHSRQFLHARLINADRFRAELTSLPPLLLPLGLAAEKDGPKAEFEETLTKAEAEARAALPAGSPLTAFLGAAASAGRTFFVQGRKNEALAHTFPLTFRQAKEKGAIELVRLSLADGAGARRLIRVTDLGLTYKLWPDGLLVWVTSLKRAEPCFGLEAAAFTKSGEVFSLGRTDDQGLLRFNGGELTGLSIKEAGKFHPVNRRVEPGEITCLAVVGRDDASFIKLRGQSAFRPVGVAWAGDPAKAKELVRGQAFTERGVYRPGEKVYFKGTARRYDRGRVVSPAKRQARFTVTDSRGEKILDRTIPLSRFGSAGGEFKLPGHAPMGLYTLDFFYGPGKNDTVSRTFQVHEFTPPRHFSRIDFQRISRTDDSIVGTERDLELIRIGVEGRYYAGGPVKGGKVRWKIYRSGTDFKLDGFKDYTFGSPGPDLNSLIESGESVLDDRGRLIVEFPLDKEVVSGQAGLTVVAAVIDVDGKAASTSKQYQSRPKMFVGISRHAKEAKAGEGQRLQVVVTDPLGKKVYHGKILAEVLQESGAYVRKRNAEGNVYWDYQSFWRTAFSSEIDIANGQADFKFDFGYGGSYRLAFTYRTDDGKEYASATAYDVTGDVYWQAYSERKQAYESLGLYPDKEAYRPGDKARVSAALHKPAAYLLVTLERDRLLKSWVVKTSGGQRQTVETILGEDCTPNAYLSVLALSPRGRFPLHVGRYDDQAPGFLFGAVNLPVRARTGHLKAAIAPDQAELKAQPGQTVQLKLTVEDNDGAPAQAELAVAVVDESVLALTGFKTPTLDDLNRFTVPLSVLSGELRRMLLHQTRFQPAVNEPLTGGGGGAGGMEMEIRSDFNPTAYFNPSVLTGADGTAEVSFKLPDTMTTYRVYAVVCDEGPRYASVDRPLLAVKPFYVEPGLPRFFVKGDKFSFPVLAFNKTDASGQATLTVDGGAGLALTGPSGPIELAAMDSQTATVAGRAAKAGPAKAIVSGKMNGLTDAVALELPVLSGLISKIETRFGRFTGRSEIDLSGLGLSGLSAELANEVTATVTLASSPLVRAVPALEYLIDYPYGCVEQTASRVIALAALSKLIKAGALPGLDAAKAEEYLAAGINRLISMELDDGSFSYWPGRHRSHALGSVYASLALLLAKESGQALPEKRIKKAMDYLAWKVKQGRRSGLFKAMAAYALALGGRLDNAEFIEAGRGYDDLSDQAKLFLLLAADKWGKGPKPEMVVEARKLLAGAGPQADPDDGFRAMYRLPAAALLAGVALLPGDPAVDKAALALMGGLGSAGRWSSTSDTSWSLYALSRYYAKAKFSDRAVAVGLTQPGRSEQKVVVEPGQARTVSLDPAALLKSPKIGLAVDSPDELVYLVRIKRPDPAASTKGAEAGFKVKRTVTNLTGGKTITVGDIVEVTVELETKQENATHVMVDDPLPAGLMAVNSAFNTEETPPTGGRAADEAEAWYWSPDGYYRFSPNYFEIREQRVLAYRARIWPGKYRFSYYARAVCAGEFTAPPTKVEMMYRPEVNGLAPASKLIVDRSK